MSLRLVEVGDRDERDVRRRSDEQEPRLEQERRQGHDPRDEEVQGPGQGIRQQPAGQRQRAQRPRRDKTVPGRGRCGRSALRLSARKRCLTPPSAPESGLGDVFERLARGGGTLRPTAGIALEQAVDPLGEPLVEVGAERRQALRALGSPCRSAARRRLPSPRTGTAPVKSSKAITPTE